ncbi:MAG: hypothetical protein NTU53_13615 [Planctomycetota bacterium]|nr:hypothetical protein [Planctomycetota bacterium]
MMGTKSDSVFDPDLKPYYPSAPYRSRIRPSVRFRECDPYEGVASEPLTLHKYAYTHNNPINGTDPTGMWNLPSLLTGFGVNAILFRFSLGAVIGGTDAAFRGYSIMQGAAWGGAFGVAGPLIPWKLGLALSAYAIGEALADRDWDSAIFRGAVAVIGLGTYRYVNGHLPGGRWGGLNTQLQNSRIAIHLKGKGWKITFGGGMGSEEPIPGPTGGRSGSTYVDITAQKMVNGQLRTLRIQTVDTRKSGAPTNREMAAAGRIKQQHPSEALILVPKQPQDGAAMAPAPFGDSDDRSEWAWDGPGGP